MFPEGTRHRGHGMLPFKKGAFNIAVDAQFDIVPVVISDYEPFYSKAKRYFRPNGKIIVQVMDPISTVGVRRFLHSFSAKSAQFFIIFAVCIISEDHGRSLNAVRTGEKSNDGSL